jgi:nucleotide sugar dehydrogenase
MSELIPIINTQKEEVVIVGLGYVGLTLAISIALKGLRVIGVDRNTEMLDNLEKYEAPIHEPGIKMLLRKTIGQNLKISNLNNFEEKLEGGFTRCYILCIGTPVISGKVKTEQLYESLDFLLKHLKRGDTVILRSTVPIGFSRSIANYLASKSGLTIGVDFYFGYAPERTVEGNAIEECSSIPQLYSGYTEVCSQKIVAVFSKISNSQIKCESLESGEFGKLMTNTYRDVIFGFSNEMALIANEYNLDINRLIDEVNLGYQRNQIKKPSPGVGGPCLSKDTYILMSGVKNDFKIIESARSVNKLMPKFVSNKILNYSKINKITRILVVGLAFKGFPETKDIRNSPSVEIVRQICNKNI